ncbi:MULTISPECIES: VOC family protein [unclassified Cellulophaga]|uniref:VOC family protein n=1 Tax=unclassified Cellulophaga TaxID=2634405 RepID=UPI0026E208B6|nr:MULTISPECIES: VOC family protein [unclassified Cellulophaga]MDO6491707.1 VOC family protein [Cellulophaga sp. 2_MG-2023]MDO6495638.1 VOC family protein [Cellulophaga sp. 3_MG-2023]
MKLHSFTLQIFEPEKTISFYVDILGFRLEEKYVKSGSTFYNLGFKDSPFYLQLKYTPELTKIKYQETATDNYWKYSLFVDDIQRVYKKIKEYHIPIKEPFQFGAIGYLSHTADLENHQIEFIQKTFKQNTKQTPPNTSSPLLDNPILGLITIRTKDPIKSIKCFEDVLDLKLFVRMYVNRGKGFTLYFLGDKNLQAPRTDIDALENREWMYQQNNLFIEIQYYWNSENETDFSLNKTPDNGFKSINFIGDLTIFKERLLHNNIPFYKEEDQIIFETVDKHQITLKNSI